MFKNSFQTLIKKNITINARKYDGKIHRTWKADLIIQSKSLLVFIGEFEEEVKHSKLGVIRRGTVSKEFYWLNRWYNIFQFYEPNGDFRNFYCNINMPPTFENNVLDYVDLDLDILVWQDFNYEILDEVEFRENAQTFRYSNQLKSKIKKTTQNLISLIEKREFPFSMTEIKY